MTAFLVVATIAIFVAELQVRQTATTRLVCLALIWLIVVGMLIYLYSGA